MEKEITYIPYGLDEISQLDLMTNLANGVPDYLNNKYWARKDKYRNAWMKAYQNIIGRGLVGASNDSGVWRVNFNGDDFPLDTMSSLDQEMYHDAAYYIQLQMAKMTPRKKEEEKKQEDLKDYKFYDSFRNHMLQNYYRGNEKLMLDPDEGWHSLDARDPKTGLRDNKNRKAQLVKVLESYKNELEANKDKYKYDNSGFADYNDVVTNIDKAIAALNSPETDDDNPALNALGLRSSTFFSNGGSDIYGTDKETGKSITYQEYYNALNELLKEQDKVNAEKLKLQRANQYGNLTFSNPKMLGTPLSSEHSSLDYLKGIAAKGRSMTPLELSELVYAFRLALKNNGLTDLSKEELQKFGRFSNLTNRPGRIKKINGVEGVYWDTIGNRFIIPNGNSSTNNSFLDILDKNNPEKIKLLEALAKKMAQDKYLANTEWTPDKTRELVGIAADVASVIDPEPISAAGLSLTGTAARTWNRIFDEDGFTLSDLGHTVLDTGLSALGAIPLVGDAALSARILGRLQKASGWLGAIFAAGSVPQAAKAAWNKVINGEDMSVDDWRAIGNVIMGFTLARRMLLNNSAGKVIQRGETIDTNSPTRILKTAEHFNKDTWNIRQKTGQEEIKSPWYKKAWNYFKDPYAKPKVEEPKKSTSEIVKLPVSSKVPSREVTPEKISKIKSNIKKLFGDINLSDTKVKHGTIQLKGNKIEVGRMLAVKTSGNVERVKQFRENTRKLLDKELDKATTNKEVHEILAKIREAKKLGWYQKGGNLDTIIEDFFKNNNI